MRAAEEKGFMGFLKFELFLFVLPIFQSLLSSSATITLGSTLSASNPNQSWTSSNSTFSVSFVRVSPGAYVAAVTYSSAGARVWSAGTVDSRGSLSLLRSGSLRLLNGSGATVWDSRTDGRGVSSASIEDSGELLLRNRSGVVWSSFDHPTDTIVQSQNFTSGMSLTSGSYSFELQRNGNLTLKWNNSIVYWTRGLNESVEGNLSNPRMVLLSNGVVTIYGSAIPGNQSSVVYSTDYGELGGPFRYIKLDDDGNLRIFSSNGNGALTPRWEAVSDQCQVYGYCGNFGICSYNDTRPNCECPSRNFVPVDPNDQRKGCRRLLELENCTGSQAMLNLPKTKLITLPPPPSSQLIYSGTNPCRSNCLSSPTCIASVAVADGSGVCDQKTPGFITGYRNVALPSTTFIKVCGTVSPNPSAPAKTSDDSKVSAWVVTIIVIAALVGLVVLEAGLWYWCCKDSPNFGGLSAHYTLLEYASGAPVQFSYKELQRCTKGFKEKLGEGGFGAVYRAVLPDHSVVAVKQLEGIEQGEKQFRMEVATISSTHHLNLVRLIGYCSEGRHRLLVYEFLKNGSLDGFLFTPEPQPKNALSWTYRFNIAVSTAKGMTYLHEECRDCIVHCDIKPENILLDESFRAKVSDFGLAKLLSPRDDRYKTLSSIRGTRGYLAPEWLANLPITSKSDVYSYGMVLLEIVGGRRNFDVSPETGGKKFSTWAYEEFDRGNIQGIIDKRLQSDPDIDMDQVKRVVEVGFWCIQEQPSQRPAMGKVVQMLEGILEIERPPPPRGVSRGPLGGDSINISDPLSAPWVSATCSSSSGSGQYRRTQLPC